MACPMRPSPMNPTFMLIPSCFNSDRPFAVILRRLRVARLSKDERPRKAKDKGHLTGANSKIGSGGQSPLWVKSRHVQCKTVCPLYPRKRHQMRHIEMSGEAKSRKAFAEQIMSAFPSSANTGGEASARLLCAKSGSRDPLPQAYLALATDSQAVAQGNQHRIKLFRRIHHSVEFLHALRVLVLLRCWTSRLAGPNRIVRNKQTAPPKLWPHRMQRGRVLVLVDIDENHVEHARRLLHYRQRVSNLDFDSLGHARHAEVHLCPVHLLRISIRIKDLASRSRCAGQPDCGVANRRPHLEDSFRAGNLHEQRQ